MRKVCVVVTARTSYTKIKPILQAIHAHKDLELQVICAASALINRYGNVDNQILRDGFPLDKRIHMIVEGETLLTSAKTTGLGIIEFATAYQDLQPDMVVIMADRYEQMAGALPAAYMNIPLVHVQGGEVTGNIDEKVRHAITKLADIHFPATERAQQYLIKMGEDPNKVIFSGCPSIDLCKKVMESPDMNFDLYKKYSGVGAFPDIKDKFIIVMQHPVTTEYGDAMQQSQATLEAVHELNIPTLWFWPNIDAGSDQTSKAIRVFREHNESDALHFFRNMEPEDFLKLLNKASAIVGNSSCAIREASYLGTPAINIGSRQQGREHAENVINCDYDKDEIKQAITTQLQHDRPKSSGMYGNGNAADIIANTLATISLSYHKRLNYQE
jgi:UDP-hydrolysing UDP-N-acetyl-D-glucosamine 2-epimerase